MLGAKRMHVKTSPTLKKNLLRYLNILKKSTVIFHQHARTSLLRYRKILYEDEAFDLRVRSSLLFRLN